VRGRPAIARILRPRGGVQGEAARSPRGGSDSGLGSFLLVSKVVRGGWGRGRAEGGGRGGISPRRRAAGGRSDADRGGRRLLLLIRWRRRQAASPPDQVRAAAGGGGRSDADRGCQLG
jgi:hypothetical protein